VQTRGGTHVSARNDAIMTSPGVQAGPGPASVYSTGPRYMTGRCECSQQERFRAFLHARQGLQTKLKSEGYSTVLHADSVARLSGIA